MLLLVSLFTLLNFFRYTLHELLVYLYYSWNLQFLEVSKNRSKNYEDYFFIRFFDYKSDVLRIFLGIIHLFIITRNIYIKTYLLFMYCFPTFCSFRNEVFYRAVHALSGMWRHGSKIEKKRKNTFSRHFWH